MGAYLITGRSGSGKTTICKELVRQDYHCFDGDQIEGLASWVNPKTGSPVIVDPKLPINPVKEAWNWDASTLSKLLNSQKGDFFLCGSAHNQIDFHHLFNKVFVLVLPAEIQRQRIMERTEHDYGKLPEMQSRILAEQVEFVKEATALGALQIDATKTPKEIIRQILAHIHAR